jgi:hypothetical protein
MNFFPTNLTNFYPNLKAIWISYSNVSSLCSRDLRQLTQLRFLYIHSGGITHMSAGLFANNKHLEYFGIRANPIHHVDVGTFSSLENLHTLYFVENSCFTGNVFNDTKLICGLVEQLERKCRNLEIASECEVERKKSIRYPMMRFREDGWF